MYNITLIGTRHEETGFCTSNELYKIFEDINPDIVFEEIPPSYFDEYYISKTRRNLESDTVQRYLENYNIQHIPIDSDDVPPESFFNDLEYLHEQIEGLTDINGFNYRNFNDKNTQYIKMHGFLYTNSDRSIAILDEIQDSIEEGLQKINDPKLFQIYQDWLKINEKRENKMLQNIYTYSENNTFNKAIFMVGFGHRKSIMQKIAKFEKRSNVNINWTFYNNTLQLVYY